jgi:outer membrane protein insertion porin family
VSAALLALALAAVSPAVGPGPAQEPVPAEHATPHIVSVELVAPGGVDLAGVDALVLIKKGQLFSAQLVRRTVELLYESGRFSNVLVYERPASDGVALIFRLVPKLRLTGVGFHGNLRLSTDELRQVSGLKNGEEFFSEKLRASLQAVTEAYRRVGYTQVRLTSQVTSGATQAEVEIEVEEGAPLRVRRVVIAGKLGVPMAQIDRALEWHPDMVLDLNKMDEALRRLEKIYRSERYFQARVGPYAVKEGPRPDLVDVRLAIDSGAQVDFAFRGNLSFDSRELRRQLDYDGEERLDEAELGRLQQRLRAFYVHKGFFDAAIELSSREHKGHLVQTFTIDEGRPLRVASIVVQGAKHFTAQQIREELLNAVREEERTALFGTVDPAAADDLGLSGRPEEREAPGFQPATALYVPELYAEAVAQVGDRYRDDGYLAVSVPMPAVDIDERSREAVITVTIEEGRRTLLNSIRFEGVHQLEQAVADEVVGLKVGKPFSRSALDDGRTALLRAYAHRGFPFARVDEQEEVSPGDPEGGVVFRVDEGPLVHIGQIVIQGPRDTRPQLIRANLTVASGQVLDADRFAQTQQNLTALGIFDQVQVAMIDPEIPEALKDVRVTVHERKPQQVVVGGGYSLVEGPRAFIEYSHDNVGGRGLRFETELKLNYFPWSLLAISGPSGSLVLEGLPPAQVLTGQDNLFGFAGRANATLGYPNTVLWSGGRLNTRLEILAESIDRPYYAFRRAAIVPSIDLRFGKHLNVTFQVQGEADQIQTYWVDLDQVYPFFSLADLQNLRFPDGFGWLGSLGPAVAYDLRDNPVNPHRGFLASAKSSWVAGTFTPSGQSGGIPNETQGCLTPDKPCPVDLISVQGFVGGYVPLGKYLTVALSAKGGEIFPIGANSFVIPTQRFFMGGADSDRGFQQDLMLPEDVRQELHGEVGRCGQTASGISCSTAAQILRTPSNQLPSPGGEVFDDLRGELRFPIIAQAVDGAVFVDAGDLWADPTKFSLLSWRPAAGVGLRVPTPIGPAILDVGFNLDPDYVVNETVVQFHFAIGEF